MFIEVRELRDEASMMIKQISQRLWEGGRKNLRKTHLNSNTLDVAGYQYIL